MTGATHMEESQDLYFKQKFSDKLVQTRNFKVKRVAKKITKRTARGRASGGGY